MATSYNHAQIGIVDAKGNVSVIYPVTDAKNVKVSSNSNVPTAKTVQEIVSHLGELAFGNPSSFKNTRLTKYVSINGSDTNDGTQEHPYRTIQYAVDHCNNFYEDNIIISEGNYNEDVNIRNYHNIQFIINGQVTLKSIYAQYCTNLIIVSNDDDAIITFTSESFHNLISIYHSSIYSTCDLYTVSNNKTN